MSARLARLYAAELDGIRAKRIEVEVDLNVGLHSFSIVGLADKALSEARERVSSAIKHSGAKPPNRDNRKITVNLAPADTKKSGPHYDLAIALGYLLASGQIAPCDVSRALFVGELSLDGRLRPIHGALPIAQLARQDFMHTLYLPEENAAEAGVVEGIDVVPIRSLQELILHLEGKTPLAPITTSFLPSARRAPVDISEVRGQAHAKRALTIAAAGGHNLIMVGPPGAGKSMLAQALASLLPPVALEEALEITSIWSTAGIHQGGLVTERPFRSPHHSASPVAIIGGGSNPRPGEVSLAHRGILFLDELPEFRRDLLESLRQPLESGVVHVARARGSVAFPAQFTLVAAMNPCPCGYAGDSVQQCRCSPYEIQQYQKKVSGPLLDRIDLQLHVPRLSLEELCAPREEQGGEPLRKLVSCAHAQQRERFRRAHLPIFTNAELSAKQCEHFIPLSRDAEAFLTSALTRSLLSARGYYRLLKVARTIADLDASKEVGATHLAEAFSYRLKEL